MFAFICTGLIVRMETALLYTEEKQTKLQYKELIRKNKH